MSLTDYFALPDTPSAKSPIGVTMARILEKYPDMQFEEARREAHELLQKAAGRFNYNMPVIRSEAEREAAKARFVALAAARKAAA